MGKKIRTSRDIIINIACAGLFEFALLLWHSKASYLTCFYLLFVVLCNSKSEGFLSIGAVEVTRHKADLKIAQYISFYISFFLKKKKELFGDLDPALVKSSQVTNHQ
jgi:hypothetical protein